MGRWSADVVGRRFDTIIADDVVVRWGDHPIRAAEVRMDPAGGPDRTVVTEAHLTRFLAEFADPAAFLPVHPNARCAVAAPERWPEEYDEDMEEMKQHHDVD